MDAMDDYIPSDTEVVEGASQKRPPAVLAAHLISLVLWVAFLWMSYIANATHSTSEIKCAARTAGGRFCEAPSTTSVSEGM